MRTVTTRRKPVQVPSHYVEEYNSDTDDWYPVDPRERSVRCPLTGERKHKSRPRPNKLPEYRTVEEVSEVALDKSLFGDVYMVLEAEGVEGELVGYGMEEMLEDFPEMRKYMQEEWRKRKEQQTKG